MDGSSSEQSTLVVGGTGKTGRRVAERLRARGVSTRIGARSADPPFDWRRPETWAPALGGVDAMYLSYYPDLAVPEALGAVTSFTSLATRLGVERIVLLSGRGEEEAERAERVVQRAGVEWTIVRCAWFAQNFSESYLLDPVLAGVVALPAGDVPEPFVDAEDIADVATAALTRDGHAGRLYELTGPRALTFAEAIGEIAGATRREIAFVPVSIDEYSSLLAEHGVPGEYVALLAYLFTEVLDGRNARLGDGVQRALGREPRDFRDFARETAATGIWDPARSTTRAA